MIQEREMGDSDIVDRVVSFVERCRLERDSWRFSSTPGGPETLYASAFACMLLHYTGELATIPTAQKQAWADYLRSWQDPEGFFLGPELSGELSSPNHSFEHVSHHLTAHVLPALSLLGSGPRYVLSFARPFVDHQYLLNWLDKRDWRQAWLEGNNLLFIGQFLIHLRDVEHVREAEGALDVYFDWLDRHQDPATGLWGSNGHCSKAVALYGGYHQLLVYRYEDRPVRYGRELVDVALSLQHEDGGFNPRGGGGACEDTDTVDVLVHGYKSLDYKRPQIRMALRKALTHLLSQQMPDGGFVYRRNQPFTHMGIQKSYSPANQSNLFPTWFRLHTLALIGEILTDEPIAERAWGYNNTCSMGWHRPWERAAHSLTWRDLLSERQAGIFERGFRLGGRLQRKVSRMRLGVVRRILGEETRV